MEREYYLLGEAASRVGYAINDLIHFGAVGELNICALMPGCYGTEHIWDADPQEEDGPPVRRYLLGPYQLPRYVLQLVEAGGEGLLSYVYDPYPKHSNFLVTIWNLDSPIDVSELRLVVFSSELARLGNAEHEGHKNAEHEGHKDESPESRRERLRLRVKEEQAKGTKAFLKVVAEEQGISQSRLKQLIKRDERLRTGQRTGAATPPRQSVLTQRKPKD